MLDLTKWALVNVRTETEMHPKDIQYLDLKERQDRMRLVSASQWREFNEQKRKLDALRRKLYDNDVPKTVFGVAVDTNADNLKIGDVR